MRNDTIFSRYSFNHHAWELANPFPCKRPKCCFLTFPSMLVSHLLWTVFVMWRKNVTAIQNAKFFWNDVMTIKSFIGSSPLPFRDNWNNGHSYAGQEVHPNMFLMVIANFKPTFYFQNIVGQHTVSIQNRIWLVKYQVPAILIHSIKQHIDLINFFCTVIT